jgi:nucleotide-binding universal stress UspA family protein
MGRKKKNKSATAAVARAVKKRKSTSRSMGSVATRVLHLAHIPVMLIH